VFSVPLCFFLFCPVNGYEYLDVARETLRLGKAESKQSTAIAEEVIASLDSQRTTLEGTGDSLIIALHNINNVATSALQASIKPQLVAQEGMFLLSIEGTWPESQKERYRGHPDFNVVDQIKITNFGKGQAHEARAEWKATTFHYLWPVPPSSRPFTHAVTLKPSSIRANGNAFVHPPEFIANRDILRVHGTLFIYYTDANGKTIEPTKQSFVYEYCDCKRTIRIVIAPPSELAKVYELCCQPEDQTSVNKEFYSSGIPTLAKPEIETAD